MSRLGQVQEAAASIAARCAEAPRAGVILGSGLGAFAEELDGAVVIPYAEIPHWPASTAVGHAGKLVWGRANGVPIVALSGRAHLYEGYTPDQAAFGTRVLATLGARSLVVTNAAGGIHKGFGQGTLVAISDHINLQGANPLTGPNIGEWGPRFPDMTEAYSLAFRRIARDAAAALGIPLPEGVYAALAGPNYETPAEIRYLRAIGADLVGMSTVPEVIAANHMGLRVLAISCVTNMAAGVLDQKINHEEVLETGRQVRGQLIGLLNSVLPKLVEEADGSAG